MIISEHFVETGDWSLHLRRTLDPERLDPAGRPLLIIPGYGMNSFIFGYHPQGTSLERCLAAQGVEVWSMNMRGQTPSRPRVARAAPASLRVWAEEDVPAGIEAVLDHTRTRAAEGRVDLLGASLGGSVAYAHLALSGDRHQVGSLVTIGSPLRWDTCHPAVRLAFGSSRVARSLRFSGTQTVARVAFPMLARVPGVLSMYMNTRHIDLSKAQDLVRTVDDPQPLVNRDIAKWIRARDMVLRGINVTDALSEVERPLLVVLANRDGIVPAGCARCAMGAWGGDDAAVLEVGTPEDWYAHADLFVGDEAPERVFDPIAQWLKARW